MRTDEQRSITDSTWSVKQIETVAGAGKTTTILACAGGLIEQGVAPERIIFLTALKGAEAVLSAKMPAGVRCMTLHALGLHLAQQQTLIRGGVSEPLGQAERKHLLARALKKEGRRLAKDRPKASAFLLQAANTPSQVKRLLEFIDLARAAGNGWARKDKREGSPHHEIGRRLDAVRGAARRFAKLKHRQQVFDYGDMIRLGRKAIEQGANLGFDHVFVDEVQDCTPAQSRMLAAMAPRLKTLTVVGDPLQAILGFAGTRYTDLSTLLPNVRTLPLTKAFRLTDRNAALATALGRLVRPDMPPIRGGSGRGRRPVLIEAQDRGEHDRALVDRVKYLTSRGVAPSQIAIIGRVRAQLREAEALLLSEGFETEPLGRERNFEHVRAVLQLTKAIRGCSGTTGKAKLHTLVEGVSDLAAVAASTRDDFVRLLMQAARSTSFESRYRACANAYIRAKGHRALSKDDIAEINRWAPMTRLVADAKGMRQLMARFAAQDKVVTSHVHRAKGDEWDHVLVIHAVEGSWPFFKAKTDEAQTEELHMLYVAATRARKSLHLFEGVYKNAKSRKTFAKPSGLLQDAAVRRCLIRRLMRTPLPVSSEGP